MCWSNKEKVGWKRFEYIRRSYLREMDFTEVIWCKGEEEFFRYLNYMNSTYRYNKFFSEYLEDFYRDIGGALE